MVVTTRLELYNEVWKTPLSKLGSKYGVSDNAIRKQCKKHNIPLPNNSYWGNFHAGKNPSVPTLDGDGSIKITFTPIQAEYNKYKIKENGIIFGYIKDEAKRNIILNTYESLSVSKSIHTYHPLIIKHKEQFAKLKKERSINPNDLHNMYRRYWFRTEYPIINLLTVPENDLSRAYHFLNSLFFAVEKCGVKIEVESNEHSYFVINDFKIEFRVKEKYIRSENLIKTKYADKYSYKPSEKLIFILDNWQEKVFSETSGKTIYMFLKDVFKKIFDIAEEKRLEKIESEKQKELQQKEWEKEQEERLIKREEYKKVKKLLSDAKLHNKANMIRNYLKEMNIQTTNNSEYIAWATQIANWMDPFIKSSHPFLNEKFEKTQMDEKNRY